MRTYNNRFFISEKARKRIESFLSSPDRLTRVHNINRYWQNRREAFNYTFRNDGIEIEGDSNLHSRMSGRAISPEYSKSVSWFVRKISKIILFLCHHVLRLQDLVIAKMQEDRCSNIYRLIFKDKKNEYLPFGLWDDNQELLQKEPFLSVIKAWPLRSLHTLRAMDVINRHRPLKNKKSVRILEIGSGPAILCGFMMDAFETKHVLIDLPEQVAVGFSFLSEFFPDKRVILPNEINKETFVENNAADVIFITPEQLSILDHSAFDIGINMFSFQEMSHETICEYFDLLKSCLKPEGIFYCMNRVSKPNKYDDAVSEFAKYPWSGKDEFLHDVTLDAYLGNIKLAGGEFRESVVRLEAKNKEKQDYAKSLYNR